MVNRWNAGGAALLSAIGSAACSAPNEPPAIVEKQAPAEASQGLGNAALPSELKLVLIQADDQLLVMIKNEGPGIAKISPIINLYSPHRNILMEVDPFPSAATTNLASRGFVMSEESFNATVEVLPKKMYGGAYALSKLARDMKLPPGCYTFTATYDGSAGVKDVAAKIAGSEPTKICF